MQVCCLCPGTTCGGCCLQQCNAAHSGSMGLSHKCYIQCRRDGFTCCAAHCSFVLLITVDIFHAYHSLLVGSLASLRGNADNCYPLNDADMLYTAAAMWSTYCFMFVIFGCMCLSFFYVFCFLFVCWCYKTSLCDVIASVSCMTVSVSFTFCGQFSYNNVYMKLFCVLQTSFITAGCLQLLEILEISWNLKTLLEILEISWNLNGPPGNFCVMIENWWCGIVCALKNAI